MLFSNGKLYGGVPVQLTRSSKLYCTTIMVSTAITTIEGALCRKEGLTGDSEFWLAAVCFQPGYLVAGVQQGVQQQPAKGGLPRALAPTDSCHCGCPAACTGFLHGCADAGSRLHQSSAL